MVAGKNRRCNIWRITFDPDDVVGGAQPTGTVAYFDVMIRMQANPEQQILLQQGLETLKTFTALVIPGTLTVHERDEIEITEPHDDIYHGERFRVVGVRYSDLNPRDPRNYIMLELIHSERAHQHQ